MIKSRRRRPLSLFISLHVWRPEWMWTQPETAGHKGQRRKDTHWPFQDLFHQTSGSQPHFLTFNVLRRLTSLWRTLWASDETWTVSTSTRRDYSEPRVHGIMAQPQSTFGSQTDALTVKSLNTFSGYFFFTLYTPDIKYINTMYAFMLRKIEIFKIKFLSWPWWTNPSDKFTKIRKFYYIQTVQYTENCTFSPNVAAFWLANALIKRHILWHWNTKKLRKTGISMFRCDSAHLKVGGGGEKGTNAGRGEKT